MSQLDESEKIHEFYSNVFNMQSIEKNEAMQKRNVLTAAQALWFIYSDFCIGGQALFVVGEYKRMAKAADRIQACTLERYEYFTPSIFIRMLTILGRLIHQMEKLRDLDAEDSAWKRDIERKIGNLRRTRATKELYEAGNDNYEEDLDHGIIEHFIRNFAYKALAFRSLERKGYFPFRKILINDIIIGPVDDWHHDKQFIVKFGAFTPNPIQKDDFDKIYGPDGFGSARCPSLAQDLWKCTSEILSRVMGILFFKKTKMEIGHEGIAIWEWRNINFAALTADEIKEQLLVASEKFIIRKKLYQEKQKQKRARERAEARAQQRARQIAQQNEVRFFLQFLFL